MNEIEPMEVGMSMEQAAISKGIYESKECDGPVGAENVKWFTKGWNARTEHARTDDAVRIAAEALLDAIRVHTHLPESYSDEMVVIEDMDVELAALKKALDK